MDPKVSAEATEIVFEPVRYRATPDLRQCNPADPAVPVRRVKLSHRTAGNCHGEHLTGFDAAQDLAHLIA